MECSKEEVVEEPSATRDVRMRMIRPEKAVVRLQ